MSIVRDLQSKYNSTILSLNVDRNKYNKGDPVYYKGEWCIFKDEKSNHEVTVLRTNTNDTVTIFIFDIKEVTPPYLCNIISRIKKSRGEELAGILPWNVLRTLIWEEISCWINPSKKLISEVFKHLHEISTKAVEYVTKHQRLLLFLKEKIIELNDSTQKSIEEEMNKIFEKEKNPATENHYFFDEIQKLRSNELQLQLKKLIPDKNGSVSMDAVSGIVKNFFGVGSQPNELYEAKEMHIIMKAYLKVSMKRVIDNVVNVINTELYKFSRTISSEIHASDEALQNLLGDEPGKRLLRAKLKKEIETCEKSLSEFKKHAIY